MNKFALASAPFPFHVGLGQPLPGQALMEVFMKAIWKGAISFGLVNIPVGIYSAVKPGREIKLRMLRRTDQSPIRYKRVAESDNQEVTWDDIVKGYEHQRGQFVILTDEDFERVNLKSTRTVDIREFVDAQELDPLLFDQPYYLAPEKGGEKAYALLREALKRAQKIGIAKVVIRTRESLAAVVPKDNALVLHLMHFQEELADSGELPLPNVELGKKELDMAHTLVESMAESWQPDKYHDEYRKALMDVIEEKIAAGGKPLPSKKGKPALTNVVDLVSVLQESINQSRKASSKPPPKEKVKKGRKAA